MGKECERKDRQVLFDVIRTIAVVANVILTFVRLICDYRKNNKQKSNRHPS